MKVLFLCTGNTCRSPMAQGLFNKYSFEKDLKMSSLSAGISVIPGSKTSKNSIDALKEYGVDISSHIPTQLTPELLCSADLVLTMCQSHKAVLLNYFPESSYKIFSIAEYVGGNDISDPYGGDFAVYKECASEINDKIIRIIERMQADEYDRF